MVLFSRDSMEPTGTTKKADVDLTSVPVQPVNDEPTLTMSAADVSFFFKQIH